ncbi:UNVERIFIED_CONTAM: hypothetical protein FKN15_052036 [Acipenser sinensis]
MALDRAAVWSSGQGSGLLTGESWVQSQVDPRFEILMGLHNKVVKPNLVAGQTLSGFLIHKVFAAKALYLRPNKMLLQMPHDDTNKITNAYASDLQDESQKPLNNESHCEVHQPNKMLLQMPHDDTNKITNAYASDLQDESQKPLNDESHCEVHHQYINILDLTQDDHSEAAILLDDNLIEPSHDGQVWY